MGGGIVDRGRAYNVMHFFLLTIGLCLICIKIVSKGASGGPRPEIFYKIRYKIRLF